MTLTFSTRTCDQFWECDCDEYFVHRKTLERYCPKCHAEEPNCPDAMVTDVWNQADRLRITQEEDEQLANMIKKLYNVDPRTFPND